MLRSLTLSATVAITSMLAVGASGQDAVPPKLRPVAEKMMDIAPFEQSSMSPFGGARTGGSDQRQFVISPDGRLIASEDAGGWQLELWSTSTGKSLGKFGQINDPVSLAFSLDSKSLVTADWGGTELAVRLWDVERREEVARLDGGVNVLPFAGVAFSPDGKTLALAPSFARMSTSSARSRAVGICLWEIATATEVRQLDPYTPNEIIIGTSRTRPPSSYSRVAFTPDGRMLGGIVGGRIVLWEIGSGHPRGELGRLPRVAAEDASFIPSLAISPNGRLLACTWSDGSIRLWDLRALRSLPPLVGHNGPVLAATFAADGATLLTLGTDKRLLTWPLKDGFLDWRAASERLSGDALAALWGDLHGNDPYAQYVAQERLAAAGEQSISLLREKVKVVTADDVAKLQPLSSGIISGDFNTRKQAAAALEQAGEAGILALSQKQTTARTAADLAAMKAIAREVDPRTGRVVSASTYREVQTRVLAKLQRHGPTVEQLQAATAVDLLEHMRSAQAIEQLTEFAKTAAAGSLLSLASQNALLRHEELKTSTDVSTPVEKLVELLASENAREAYVALRTLVDQADASPVAQKLESLATSDALDADRRIAKLIQELDNDDFEVREQAAKSLAQLGALAAPALREAAETELSAEAKQRIASLLETAAKPGVLREQLQARRLIEALEHMGTPAAQQVLERLLQQPPRSAWLTEELECALKRMNQ